MNIEMLLLINLEIILQKKIMMSSLLIFMLMFGCNNTDAEDKYLKTIESNIVNYSIETYHEIYQKYECSDKKEGYMVVLKDVLNLHEVRKKITNSDNQFKPKIIREMLNQIHFLKSKYTLDIVIDKIDNIDKKLQNLYISHLELATLKELKYKIVCDN